MKKSGKFMKKCEVREKSEKNEIVLANVQEIVDIAYFYFYILSIKISVTFCYTVDKLKSGKSIVSQGKVREMSGKIKT